jgi:hypothetical protein
MKLLICIDDTDNLESPGTGHLAEILRNELEALFNGKTSRITRHQLFVSEEIPYTSHNSAMCFAAGFSPEHLDGIIRHAQNFLEKNGAPGSDPGLCIAAIDSIRDREKLIAWGKSALTEVLTKDEACALAAELNIHLSGHGGTGGGIIGALAGAALRLCGNNGRFKGWIPVEHHDMPVSVGALTVDYPIDEVRSTEGLRLPSGDEVRLAGRIKTVLIDHRSVLLVKEDRSAGTAEWVNLPKEELRKY